MFRWMDPKVYVIMIKPYVHVIAALCLWVFALTLLATEQASSIMINIDRVHTYSLNKAPGTYDQNGARSTIQSYFASNWLPADDQGCMALTNWTGNATCTAKRNGLVTTTRSALNCDIYRSPGCNCVNQILKGIANDTNPNPLLPNTFTGSFATIGRNMTGQSATVLLNLESCHYLFHSVYLAGESGSTLVRRAALLFLITTMVAFNALFYVLFHGVWMHWSAMSRSTLALIGPLFVFITALATESATINLVLYIMFPPLVILALYEYFAHTSPHEPFLHPFFFAEILPALVTLAMVENSVIDYDNLTFEIFKAHAISFAYMGIVWFNMNFRAQEHNKKDMLLYTRRPQQDGIYITSMMVALISLNTAMAPYTAACYLNVVWWLPTVFVLFNLFAVLWVDSWDKFRDQPATETQRQDPPGHIKNDALYISSVLLIITAILTAYYWRDYSTVLRAPSEYIPLRSVQVNSSLFWLNPVF